MNREIIEDHPRNFQGRDVKCPRNQEGYNTQEFQDRLRKKLSEGLKKWKNAFWAL